MTETRNPEALARSVVQRLVDSRNPFRDDLLQEARIAIWIYESRGVTYQYMAARHRCLNFLKRWFRTIDAQRLAARRRYYERLHVCSKLEYVELREYCMHLLGEHKRVEQGAKDCIVFGMWLEGSSCKEISERCPWLRNSDSAERCLERIVRALRLEFGTDGTLEIRIRGDKRFSGKVLSSRAGRNITDYNRSYYEAHREEAKKRVARSRHRRQIHDELLKLGYTRYGLASSGASAYYVHSDGFRVRVSDHEPRSQETDSLVNSGQMYLINLDQVKSAAIVVVAVESARTAAAAARSNQHVDD